MHTIIIIINKEYLVCTELFANHFLFHAFNSLRLVYYFYGKETEL